MRWTFDANDETRIRPVAARDDLAERLADDALRPRHAGPLGVRRVAEQQVDAAVAELGELADVGAQAVDRRVVELVVAGVDDAARRASRARRRPRPGSSAPCARTRAGTAPSSTGSSSGSASRSSAARSRPCSSSFDLTSPSVSRVAQTSATPHLAHAGTAASRRGPRAPCVSTTARIVARGRAGTRSRAGRGRRRGARRAGTRGRRRRRRSSPSDSKTVMFFPTSPRPPSGMMRTTSAHVRPRQS